MSLSHLANKLREARKHAHMDAVQAGEAVGRSSKTIYAWECGAAEPSAEQLLALCRAYGVEISYFYPPEYSTPWRGLSIDERKLLDGYRKLDTDGKRMILALLDYRGEVR